MVTFGRSKGNEYFIQKELVSEIRYIKPEWWKLTTNFNYLNPVNGKIGEVIYENEHNLNQIIIEFYPTDIVVKYPGVLEYYDYSDADRSRLIDLVTRIMRGE